MKPAKIETQSITEQVAEYLAQAIIAGELAGEERIQEQPWAERLGVSRGSVREALLVLERRHMVRIEPRKGARVVALSSRWVTEIAEAWLLILGDLVRRIPDRLDAEAEALMKRRLEAMRKARAAGDGQAFFDATLDLVETAAELAEHEVLQRLLAGLMPAVRRCFRFALDNIPQEEDWAMGFAEALVAAVEARDGAEIARVLASFGQAEIDRLSSALEQAP
ncbi:MAG: GntR family transcriptional regulator [Xanthomonadales bacterium]|nr:GntR family transcriptional regulator [Xanthomonadales bacterium]